MVMATKYDLILFWEWFRTISKKLEINFDQEDLIEEIDKQVRLLGDFSWELGLGIHTSYSFVISPNCNRKLLNDTKEIIRYSPSLTSWEFYYAKPPKIWNLIFSFTDNNGKDIKINAQDWEYVLLKFPDNSFDVIIKTSNNHNLDRNNLNIAAEILLIGILGEEVYIEHIVTIDIVNNFETKYIGKESKMIHFKEHFTEVSARSDL